MNILLTGITSIVLLTLAALILELLLGMCKAVFAYLVAPVLRSIKGEQFDD